MSIHDSNAQPATVAEAFTALAETMRQLTADDGCAWHGVQTHQTLIRYLIEESFELVEAIETQAAPAEVKEELADLLYQVLFHAAIAERDGEGYSVVSVANTLNVKLIARHPHVFGDRGYMSVDELNAEWEQLKANASGQRRGVLDGIADATPTLARAEKVIDRLERAGLLDALPPTPKTTADIGRDLLELIRVAHASGVNADEALRVALRELTENIRE
jgi:uncharacterized protein YabN with tetrapyrrole methylase and pyrophosphatase domain